MPLQKAIQVIISLLFEDVIYISLLVVILDLVSFDRQLPTIESKIVSSHLVQSLAQGLQVS